MINGCLRGNFFDASLYFLEHDVMPYKKSLFRLWVIVLFLLILWGCCVLVFSDLCLNFGGGGPCTSKFDYPDLVVLIAMLGTFGLTLVVPVLVVGALVVTVVKVLRSRWLAQK